MELQENGENEGPAARSSHAAGGDQQSSNAPLPASHDDTVPNTAMGSTGGQSTEGEEGDLDLEFLAAREHSIGTSTDDDSEVEEERLGGANWPNTPTLDQGAASYGRSAFPLSEGHVRDNAASAVTSEEISSALAGADDNSHTSGDGAGDTSPATFATQSSTGKRVADALAANAEGELEEQREEHTVEYQGNPDLEGEECGTSATGSDSPSDQHGPKFATQKEREESSQETQSTQCRETCSDERAEAETDGDRQYRQTASSDGVAASSCCNVSDRQEEEDMVNGNGISEKDQTPGITAFAHSTPTTGIRNIYSKRNTAGELSEIEYKVVGSHQDEEEINQVMSIPNSLVGGPTSSQQHQSKLRFASGSNSTTPTSSGNSSAAGFDAVVKGRINIIRTGSQAPRLTSPSSWEGREGAEDDWFYDPPPKQAWPTPKTDTGIKSPPWPDVRVKTSPATSPTRQISYPYSCRNSWASPHGAQASRLGDYLLSARRHSMPENDLERPSRHFCFDTEEQKTTKYRRRSVALGTMSPGTLKYEIPSAVDSQGKLHRLPGSEGYHGVYTRGMELLQKRSDTVSRHVAKHEEALKKETPFKPEFLSRSYDASYTSRKRWSIFRHWKDILEDHRRRLERLREEYRQKENEEMTFRPHVGKPPKDWDSRNLHDKLFQEAEEFKRRKKQLEETYYENEERLAKGKHEEILKKSRRHSLEEKLDSSKPRALLLYERSLEKMHEKSDAANHEKGESPRRVAHSERLAKLSEPRSKAEPKKPRPALKEGPSAILKADGVESGKPSDPAKVKKRQEEAKAACIRRLRTAKSNLYRDDSANAESSSPGEGSVKLDGTPPKPGLFQWEGYTWKDAPESTLKRHPSKSSTAASSNRREGNFVRRAEFWVKAYNEKQRNIANRQAEKELEEAKNCSFKPKINPVSRHLTEHRSKGDGSTAGSYELEEGTPPKGYEEFLERMGHALALRDVNNRLDVSNVRRGEAPSSRDVAAKERIKLEFSNRRRQWEERKRLEATSRRPSRETTSPSRPSRSFSKETYGSKKGQHVEQAMNSDFGADEEGTNLRNGSRLRTSSSEYDASWFVDSTLPENYSNTSVWMYSPEREHHFREGMYYPPKLPGTAIFEIAKEVASDQGQRRDSFPEDVKQYVKFGHHAASDSGASIAGSLGDDSGHVSTHLEFSAGMDDVRNEAPKQVSYKEGSSSERTSWKHILDDIEADSREKEYPPHDFPSEDEEDGTAENNDGGATWKQILQEVEDERASARRKKKKKRSNVGRSVENAARVVDIDDAGKNARVQSAMNDANTTRIETVRTPGYPRLPQRGSSIQRKPYNEVIPGANDAIPQRSVMGRFPYHRVTRGGIDPQEASLSSAPSALSSRSQLQSQAADLPRLSPPTDATKESLSDRSLQHASPTGPTVLEKETAESSGTQERASSQRTRDVINSNTAPEELGMLDMYDRLTTLRNRFRHAISAPESGEQSPSWNTHQAGLSTSKHEHHASPKYASNDVTPEAPHRNTIQTPGTTTVATAPASVRTRADHIQTEQSEFPEDEPEHSVEKAQSNMDNDHDEFPSDDRAKESAKPSPYTEASEGQIPGFSLTGRKASRSSNDSHLYPEGTVSNLKESLFKMRSPFQRYHDAQPTPHNRIDPRNFVDSSEPQDTASQFRHETDVRDASSNGIATRSTVKENQEQEVPKRSSKSSIKAIDSFDAAPLEVDSAVAERKFPPLHANDLPSDIITNKGDLMQRYREEYRLLKEVIDGCTNDEDPWLAFEEKGV
eukprot:gb/GECG01001552.1/.p1 GENE.gb/GECG01001552.1/~~gb/GECG01001552.1/.p1  ORF type:complete len:1772 (+),score=298.14 gb/GECG01001552.1/:1-5316(+)